MSGAHEHATAADPAAYWDARYGGSERMWTGNVNQSVAAVAADLPPGTALDLGCGEGGDALWLAGRGWEVTAVDVSATAVERARAAAAAAGLDDRIRFVVTDLQSWEPSGGFDLVTAAFLHSPIAFERTQVLRHAAALVAAGGHLLVVAHAGFPPWASDEDRSAHGGHDGPASHRFLTPDEEVDELALPPGVWEVDLAEVRTRPATAPDGTPAELDDSVVLLRRRSS